MKDINLNKLSSEISRLSDVKLDNVKKVINSLIDIAVIEYLKVVENENENKNITIPILYGTVKFTDNKDYLELYPNTYLKDLLIGNVNKTDIISRLIDHGTII